MGEAPAFPALGERATALLERESELASIDALLERIQASSGGAIFLEGPAGIGKTALLREAQRRSEALGVKVLRSQGGEMESGLAWSGALELFGSYADSELLDELPAGLVRPLLSRAATDGAGQLALLHGLHWLVVRASDQVPLLIELDDSHLSDAETLSFIAYLLDRIEYLPVGIMIAARRGEPLTSAAKAALRLCRSHRLTRYIKLRALGPQAARQLARSALPADREDLADSVAGQVGGNPYLCLLLATSLRDAEGSEASPQGITLRLIQREVETRLGRYGPEATAVAEALAIFGQAPAAYLSRLAEVSQTDAAEILDRLVAVGLIEAEPRFRFTHPLVKEAVYAGIGMARRAQLHRKAARVLWAHGSPVQEIASHLMVSDPTADEWAIDVLIDAAKLDLAVGAAAQAAERYRKILSADLARERRARVLLALGKAEIEAGQSGGLKRLRDAVMVLPPNRADIKLMLGAGESLYSSGRFDAARSMFAQGLDILEKTPDDDRDAHVEARLLAGLDIATLLTGGREERALEVARELAVNPGRFKGPAGRTLMAMAAGEFALGIDRERETVIELGLGALSAGGHDELGRAVLESLAAALVYCEQYSVAKRLLGAVVDESSVRGEVVAHASLLAIKSYCHLCCGEIVDAEADAGTCIRIAEEFPAASAKAVPIARYVLARSSLAAGRTDDAHQAVSTASWAGQALNPLDGWLLAGRAHVRLNQGDAAAALEDFTKAGSVMTPFSDAGVACDWRTGAALCLKELSRDSEARSLAAAELGLAEAFGGRRVIGLALRRCAKVARDRSQAVELLERSVETLEGSGGLLDFACSSVELGAAQRRSGKLRLSRETLRKGLALARDIEARAVVARAADELVLAGARRPGLALSGVESLTPSQRRVARMAAEGMSNSEIAASLFITRRTVETHLTATYSKLGINSRHQLRAENL